MSTQPNSERYAPPEGYYDRTVDRPPSDFLVMALKMQTETTGKTALDFGCGAGSQTRYILEKGYSVVAVDGNKEAGDFIERLPHQDKVTFIKSDFETFVFGEYDLIYSLHALSFADKEQFNEMFGRLKTSLRPGGIFAGQIYGVNDEWNKPGETMTFLSKSEVENLLKDMKIVRFVEKDQQGTVADNTPKHWHVFEVVALKP